MMVPAPGGTVGLELEGRPLRRRLTSARSPPLAVTAMTGLDPAALGGVRRQDHLVVDVVERGVDRLDASSRPSR